MKLKPVGAEDRELLWNITQKYLYELTNYYDKEMDGQGNIAYRYFDAYFTDPKRKALLIYEQQLLVGFAMLHPYSSIDGEPDHVLAEFTVFPMFRGRGLAAKAAEELFRQFKGCWEIKYSERNIAAKSLWNKVTAAYSPQAVPLNDEETVLSFEISK